MREGKWELVWRFKGSRYEVESWVDGREIRILRWTCGGVGTNKGSSEDRKQLHTRFFVSLRAFLSYKPQPTILQ